MNATAYVGDTALRMWGSRTTWIAPNTAIITNHTTMTGPNALPTRSVPLCWVKNNVVMITAPSGTTYAARPGCTSSRPSTADITDTAGVITLSPKNRAAPITPSIMMRPHRLARVGTPLRVSAARESTPPSPSLSACMTTMTYLRVTIRASTQKKHEVTP